MTTQTDLFADTTAARHHGSPESTAANDRMGPGRKARQREMVLAEIRTVGIDGMTCKELAEWWSVGQNAISGRFTELKQAGMITRLTDPNGVSVRRLGAAVYRARA